MDVELTSPKQQPFRYTAIIRGDEACIVSWHHHRQLSFQSGSGQFLGTVNFDYDKHAERHFRLTVGAGLSQQAA